MVGGRPLLPEILGQPAPVEAKTPILNRYSLTLTWRKSTTRFPMSLRWSSYVAPKPPKLGTQKRKTPFSV